MILKRVRVKNFRAIRDATIELGAQTAILGGNGAGKSTILRAIDRFYSPSTQVELDDFFGRRVESPIEISLTFTAFSDEEQDRFERHIQDDEMTVTRVFEPSGARNNGRYFGSTTQHAEFSAIRAVTGATERRDLFRAFMDERADYGFVAVRRADEIEPQLKAWEVAHADQCEPMRDDGQFFGFTNVGRGSLQKSTTFVFVPAVRDASVDAQDAKGAAVARLMELVVRSAVQQRAEVRTFQADVTERYRELVDPARLPELGNLAGALTATLQDFYAEAGVSLTWRPPEDFQIPLPAADISLEEDGFDGPVDRKGHGLQRAFIVTLLQHLARASAQQDAKAPNSEAVEEGEALAVVEEVAFVLPGLILAIEEPELYQHPTKQRHLAKVLTCLSDGSLPGVAAQTQVVFASHSSLFVSLDRFDEVRLARRHAPAPDAPRECRLTSSTLSRVAARLEDAFQRPAGTFDADGLRGRLHIIGPELAEGFFADFVVLVEGPSDRAALLAAASLEHIDLGALGIAVLPAEGKNNLDRPAAIFLELDVPLYVIWDSDQTDTTIEGVVANRALQRLLGVEDVLDAATVVAGNYATFDRNLERQIRAELTADVFDRHVNRVRDLYGLQYRDDVLKAPFAMTEVLASAAAEGARCETLAQIVHAVVAKRNAGQAIT